MAKALVMKFGGSSVKDAERLKNVARLVEAVKNDHDGVIVVLSALGGATDEFIKMGKESVAGKMQNALTILDALLDRHAEVAHGLFGAELPLTVRGALQAARDELSPLLQGASLLRELPHRSADFLAGRGEIISSLLLANFMNAHYLDAREVIKTDSHFGSARPDMAKIKAAAAEKIQPLLSPGAVIVTQGFIGADPEGVSTTLGRGGSDYSASLFGAAIHAHEIQIWTDVEGVLTADPRLVPSAQPIEILGYDEAAELAAFGAKVLHPATILPAVDLGIPVTVRNSLVPQGKFTTIAKGASSKQPVTALATRGPVTVLTLTNPRMLGGSGFLARIFEVFGRLGVSVDTISTSEVSVSVTINNDAPIVQLRNELAGFAQLDIKEKKAIVALVGEDLKRTSGVPGRALSALNNLHIEMISLGANDINLSIIIAQENAKEAMQKLHKEFFE